jgi:hypothetical protein
MMVMMMVMMVMMIDNNDDDDDDDDRVVIDRLFYRGFLTYPRWSYHQHHYDNHLLSISIITTIKITINYHHHHHLLHFITVAMEPVLHCMKSDY